MVEEIIKVIEGAGFRWSMFMTAIGTYDMVIYNSSIGHTANGSKPRETAEKALEWMQSKLK